MDIFCIDVLISSCLNDLSQYARVSQQTRKQLLMTNEMTDNLDVTNLLENSLEGIYIENQIKKKKSMNWSVINMEYHITYQAH